MYTCLITLDISSCYFIMSVVEVSFIELSVIWHLKYLNMFLLDALIRGAWSFSNSWFNQHSYYSVTQKGVLGDSVRVMADSAAHFEEKNNPKHTTDCVKKWWRRQMKESNCWPIVLWTPFSENLYGTNWTWVRPNTQNQGTFFFPQIFLTFALLDDIIIMFFILNLFYFKF